tara:strand:- start:136 stop:348 length:213 start_codon:yes stop_codon:yes gene_type:complete
MSFIKKSIEVTYIDNSYGKSETKTKSFSTDDETLVTPHDVMKHIEEWRFDNGYQITSEINLDNFTLAHQE